MIFQNFFGWLVYQIYFQVSITNRLFNEVCTDRFASKFLYKAIVRLTNFKPSPVMENDGNYFLNFNYGVSYFLP